MAVWNLDKAHCDHPEDTDLLSSTSNTNKSIMNATYRGRRVGSRVRAASLARDDAGGDTGSWVEGDAPSERTAEISAGGGATGVGRGRGRGRKVEVKWVMCDACQRWRKLTPGMRLEDLPEKW